MKNTEVQNKLRINSETSQASECISQEARSLSNRLSIWIIKSASISLLSRITIKAKRIIYPQSLYADTCAIHACRISRYRSVTADNRNAWGYAARNVAAPIPIAVLAVTLPRPRRRPRPSPSPSPRPKPKPKRAALMRACPRRLQPVLKAAWFTGTVSSNMPRD